MSDRPTTALAFDFGLKRIGCAYGQSITNTAQPLNPVKALDGTPNWDNLKQIIDEWQPQALVVGLPLNMDGTISDMSRRARKFANRLNERFKLPTYLCDERLTSREAKERHIEAGGGTNFGQESVDGIAAQLILEAWFTQTALIPSQQRLEDIYE